MLNWVKRLVGRPDTLQDEQIPAVPAPSRPPVVTTPAYGFGDPGVRIAAIGDLHGRIDLLQKLEPVLDAAARDPSRRLIEVYLGDYVDRGTNPRAVIDHLIARTHLTDRTVVCLAGNHEQMMLAAVEKDSDFVNWLDFGGQSTLASYGLSSHRAAAQPAQARAELAAAIPAEHLAFLKGLPLFYEHAGFYFVHAGVRPGVPLGQQAERDLLWIRQPFLNSTANLGAIVVHGHTPTRTTAFRLNRIGIDTGAYQTGILTCLLVTSDQVVPVDTGRLTSLS